MNNSEINNFTWLVLGRKAWPKGSNFSYDCFLDDGTYSGEDLEVVWQYKTSEEPYWDNLEGELTESISNQYETRQLVRVATEDKYKYVDASAQYQDRVFSWVVTCFGKNLAINIPERTHRYLEESLELVQSLGCTKEEAQGWLDYVFNRPPGEVSQEIGGAMVTLAALCAAAKYNMNKEAEKELSANWLKMEAIKEKMRGKPTFHIDPENAEELQRY